MTDAPPDRPAGYHALNRYTRIIVDEAEARGIVVSVVEPALGELSMSFAGRTVSTMESLSELTSAVAFRRCDHKVHTRQTLERAGLTVPAGRLASFDDDDIAFLDRWKDIVVKPARGEGGSGVSVGVVDADGLRSAVRLARALWPEVLLEQRVAGDDLRIVVIGGAAVAASVRRPPSVTGTGAASVTELIEELNDHRAAATGGASSVPFDDITRDTVRREGYELDDVVAEGTTVVVRGAANLHTGGTIVDVTEQMHPALAEVAVAAAAAIGIPVLGLDLMVTDVRQPEYAIIEANEQPGLANHEPQPTVERFVDLLFPETAT